MLVGRLGGQPELRTTEGGSNVANFSLATSRSYKPKGSDEFVTNTEWHNIVAWGYTAEKAAKYDSGTLVYVEGSLQRQEWEDKDTSKKMSKVEVNIQTIQKLADKKGGGNATDDSTDSAPPQSPTIDAKFDDMDDELPF